MDICQGNGQTTKYENLSNGRGTRKREYLTKYASYQHNEALWRSQFSEAYLWLFSAYANKISELKRIVNLQINPNPAQDMLHISNYKWKRQDSLEIINMKGVKLIQLNSRISNTIDISKLKPGSYIIIIRSENTIYQSKFLKQ
ncbi:MAG: hypothetical protein B7C24_05555 [Bacteroidetes bacterium 4572_77]|nr:MAG: hypothetical protein B7C24_05555 [Bacteroidetes bacterium 4572_77]